MSNQKPQNSFPLSVHHAFKKGDIEALKSTLGHPPDFPNTILPMELAMGNYCLEYAIYHSPLGFIRSLLELGAKQDYEPLDGFPPLIAALSSGREDTFQILELLISYGADIEQRGINDYTPLHYAAAGNDVRAVELLLSHGANPLAKTRIDECATPLEEAEQQQATDVIPLLKTYLNS